MMARFTLSVNKSRKQRALIIFLKYPQTGKVKTRLAKGAGKRNALEIYRHFVEVVLDKAKEIQGVEHFIFYTPSGKRKPLEKTYGNKFIYYVQRGKDLGKRIFNAFNTMEKLGYRQMVIIGTDSPTLPNQFIRMAFSRLKNSDMVIGPCVDGGYYLLGLRQVFKELFEDINWSSNKVFAQTLKKAKHLNLRTYVLPRWYDIDTIQDLKNYNAKKEF